jgi:hypothetical protein
MKGNPRAHLPRIVGIWAFLTLVACTCYVVYLRTLPPDELVMANTLSFQVLVSVLFVAVPSFGLLLVVLLVGAVLRSVRSRRSKAGHAL